MPAKRVALLLLGALTQLPGSTWAAPITSPTELSAGFTLIDFESLPTNGNVTSPLPNPLVIGNATFTSLTGEISLFDLSLTSWTADPTIVGSKTLFPGAEPDSAIAIDFSTPIAQFLVGWGDPNFAGNVLVALDAHGSVLETAAVALGPGGGGHAAWIGFVRPTADISRIIIQPDQSQPFGDDYAIDNVHYNAAPVPEPTTLLLLGASLAVVFARRANSRNIFANRSSVRREVCP
jgi:hypothetical protein